MIKKWLRGIDSDREIVTYWMLGRGGSLVDWSPFVRRVVDSNPALIATCGSWASPSLAVAYMYGASVWNSDTVSVLYRERLWVEVDLKRRYRNGLHEWMMEATIMMTTMEVFHYNNDAFSVWFGFRRSLRPYGVKAVLIEPGGHKTPMSSAQTFQVQLLATWNNAPSAAKAECGDGFLREGGLVQRTWNLLNCNLMYLMRNKWTRVYFYSRV